MTTTRSGGPRGDQAGRKDDGGKARYDLIPPGPLALVVEVFTIGAGKYGARNWTRGLAWGRVFAALMRHAWAWWAGEKRDPDGQHHLASVAWCAMALMEYEYTHPDLDDRPAPAPYVGLMAELRQPVGFKGIGSSDTTGKPA